MVEASIRVYLIAEHTALRKSLALLLAGEGMVIREWGEEYASAEPGLFRGAQVLLVALSQDGRCGLDFVRKMTAFEGFPPCIVLSADGDPSSVRRAFRAGARGYVTHRDAPDKLACAVREVVAGRRYESSGSVTGESKQRREP